MNETVNTVDILEILEIIPHRYPILLVDKVIDVNIGKSATGIKNVTFNEPHFMGHFPKNPVMPGVLIVEAMAQTSAVLIGKEKDFVKENKSVFFMSIDKVKFRQIVRPGDVLHLKVELVQNRGNVWKFRGEAFVEDQLVTEAEFVAMVRDN